MVDFSASGRCELFPLISIEALVSELDTVDLLDTIVVVETVDYFSDNNIEAWAETSTGNDTSADLVTLPEKIFSGTASQVLLSIRNMNLGPKCVTC